MVSFSQAPIADAMAIVWEFFQPLLFGLIGAEVSIEYMESTLIGMKYNIKLSFLRHCWKYSRC